MTEETGLCLDDFHWEEAVEKYRFECVTGGSFKFYEVELLTDAVDDNGDARSFVVVTRYGSMKPGAHVTVKKQGFVTKSGALAMMEPTIQTRLKHGYTQVLL